MIGASAWIPPGRERTVRSPCISFVPVRVTRLIAPPVVRPYSAEKLLVRMVISWIASRGMFVKIVCRPQESSAVPPSTFEGRLAPAAAVDHEQRIVEEQVAGTARRARIQRRSTISFRTELGRSEEGGTASSGPMWTWGTLWPWLLLCIWRRRSSGRLVPSNLEFGAYRKRGKAPARRGRVSPGGLRGAHSVYTRRTHGRGILACRCQLMSRRPRGLIRSSPRSELHANGSSQPSAGTSTSCASNCALAKQPLGGFQCGTRHAHPVRRMVRRLS